MTKKAETKKTKKTTKKVVRERYFYLVATHAIGPGKAKVAGLFYKTKGKFPGFFDIRMTMHKMSGTLDGAVTIDNIIEFKTKQDFEDAQSVPEPEEHKIILD